MLRLILGGCEVNHCKQFPKYKSGDVVVHKITKNKGQVVSQAGCPHDYYKIRFSQLVKYPDGTEKYEILENVMYIYEYELE